MINCIYGLAKFKRKNVKKKILLISNMYPSEKYPHYGVFVENTVNVLKSAGFKLHIISIKKVDNKLNKLFKYILFYTKSILYILFGNYEIIYAHYASHTAFPVLIGNFFKRKKVIVNVHGNDVIPETGEDIKYLKLTSKLLTRSDGIICPSEYFKMYLIKNYNIDPLKLVVYPSGGVNTKLFAKMSKSLAREKIGVDLNYDYIGYISRIEKNKGWDIFLKACKEIINTYKNIKIIVVGDGSQIDEYNRLVDELNIRNYIIKYELLSQEKIMYVYNALNVFVFPSNRKSESLGLVGLEAMACQALVVVSDKYGPSSYSIDLENSFIFESGNEKSLYKSISKALDYKGEEIGVNARRTAELYNHENTDSILVNYFKEFIS